jgi:hypothetical protein
VLSVRLPAELSRQTHENISQVLTFVVEEDGRSCLFTNRHQTQDKQFTIIGTYLKTQLSIRLIEFIEELVYKSNPITGLDRPSGFQERLRLPDFKAIGI